MHDSTVPGRMIFKVRNGTSFHGLARATIGTPVWEPNASRYRLSGTANAPAGAQVSYEWSVVSGNAIVSPSNQTTSYVTFISGSFAVVTLVVEVNFNGIVAKTSNRVTLVKP